ncbi:uncharacterized protein [Littorina saxatilis]|uniref:uncharacterized protein isoform X2 n=1 Tax=Littorina saxatilis TaxID=31220 RepID=UPI0038B4465A
MEKLPLLALLCFGCGLAAAQDQCATMHLSPSPNKMALPMLPTTAFKAVVRAQILNKNMTVEAVEYADESVNSAAIVMMQNGEKATIIMSYATNEVFYVMPRSSSELDTAGPMSCYTSNLTTDDNTQLFGMSAGSSAPGSQQHLFSTNKILNFINGTEVYKGQVNIGGIPANRFSSCVYWPQLNANFTLEYYFTLPGWQTPSGLDQIPIRAEITGISHNKTGSTSIFHHIYEYVNFEPYVDDPETIFETPPGVYCLFRKPTRKPPMINNHFYYREEISNPGNDDGDFPMISESDVWYDYDLQLVRFDERTVPAGVSANFSMSSGPFRVIHDYGVGVQYTIAVDMNECSVDPIPLDSKGFDAVYNITRQTLGMRKPMQFFNLNETTYLYAGQRLARGQQCDVFQAVLTNIPGHGIVVYEVYFLSGADDITDRGSDSVYNSIKAIPMRIMMWETGTLAQQYEIHDFDQDSAQANAFDVTPCFPGQSSIDFVIALKVKDTNLMPQLAPYVGQLMQLLVSISTGITPVRVQRTRLHWTNHNVYFEGTLLGAAPSLAKYEISPTSAMSGVASKALQNIADAMTCAQQCDNLEEWNCVQFDYCGTSMVCTLAKVSKPATLTNTSQCDHYQRVLGGGFDQQIQLDQAWTSLKNRVYGGQLVISLPLPDSSGKVDLSIDTTTLDDTKKIILTAITITNLVVSNVNRDGTSKMALPILPTTAFKAVVRAQILNKNMTVEAVEYADESVNSAAIVMMQNGEKATIIMSYATNEVFYVMPSSSTGLDTAGPMSCYTSNLTTDDNTQLFGMSTGSSAPGSQQHLFSTNKILNFINGTEVYKGQVNIGGIPANRFSSCVYWPQLNANFTLEYYFTLPGWQTPSGLDQIPIRAEITGISHNKTGSTSIFHHIYEYVNFEPYVNDPETIFETPPGVYCLFRKPTRKPPMINNHFYYREEISNPGNDDGDFPMISESDIWYDYDLQLVRFDERTVPAGVSADFSMSSGPFRVIHDYGVGVQYTIAVDMNECSVDPIPLDSKGFDAVYNITRQTLGMRKPMQFFNLNETTYLYAGQRLARGQQCDVFQAVLTNIPGHGIVVYEVYFLSGADDITDRGSDSDYNSIKAIPMRIMMWETGTLDQQYEIHDFDQDSAQANAFDVTPCFPGQSSIDFEIALKVKDTNLMPQLAPYVGQLMQLQVSINAGITPVRVQRTRLHWTNYNVYFEGTLLGAAPSLAKYEISPASAMSGVASKALQNIADAMTCAQQCDNLDEWNCVQFDYCGTSMVCTLAKVSNPATLTNTSQCDHYQRVLGGGFDQQAQLDQVWTSLKNRVYGGQLVISLPLPDSSGKVDLSIDTTTLDDTKKIILTAITITNQVVSNVNRDGTSNVMSQFQTIPQKAGKGYKTMLPGLSVDECASNCVGEETYNCQSFHYCWEAGACFLSRLHPDERPNMLKDNPNCDLYIRDYTSNFDKFDGQTVLSGSNTIYQNVMSASECAKLCTYYNTFHCESFDFCTDVNTCFLGQTHYYDAPKGNIKQAPSCAHYSRAYLQDFVAKSHKQVRLRDNRVIQGVNPQQCAKLCVEEGSFTCNSFDYCGNYSECRLSDASVSNTGQVTLESSASCDVYSRQYSSGQTAAQTSDGGSSSSGGYSRGAMAGLGFAMIVVGIILGLVALVVYDKFIAKRGGADGMAISFSKHENSES